MANRQAYIPIVEVTRGYQVESRHHGAIAAIDAAGRLIASVGDPGHPAYVRSCAKPFQALALVCSGAADAFGLTDAELAIVCASHGGEPEQVALVRSVLAKARTEESWLGCGAHAPLDRQTAREMAARGEEPTAVHNNCSGKHAGMLALARHLDLSTEDYLDPEHGVQVAIRGILAYLAGLETGEIEVSIDGCSAPSFRLPLRGFALAAARLAAAGEGLPIWSAGPGTTGSSDAGDADTWDDLEEPEEDYDEEAGQDPEDERFPVRAPRSGPDAPESTGGAADLAGEFPVAISEGLSRIWHAMKDHPALIAGSRGRICTSLMKVAASFGVPLVAKSGAEGSYVVAAVHGGQAIGIATKIEDGAQRARDAAVIETLFQLELLPDEARGPLAGFHRQAVLSHRQDPVGEIRPCFRLSRGLPS